MKHKNKGFTLVELIVVLVILAILAALLVPALTGYIDKAKEKKVIAETRMLHTAIQTEMSALYAKPEWKNFTPSWLGTAVLAAKTSDDTSVMQRYNDIVALSELTSLSSGTGVFGAYVTETGKVASLVYYDEGYTLLKHKSILPTQKMRHLIMTPMQMDPSTSPRNILKTQTAHIILSS